MTRQGFRLTYLTNLALNEGQEIVLFGNTVGTITAVEKFAQDSYKISALMSRDVTSLIGKDSIVDNFFFRRKGTRMNTSG